MSDYARILRSTESTARVAAKRLGRSIDEQRRLSLDMSVSLVV